MRNTIIVLSALFVAGCATDAAQRTAAERLAGQVSRMQTDLAAMAESRTNIAIARDHITERLLRSGIETELVNTEHLQSLTSDQRRMFDNAIKTADSEKARKGKAEAEILASEAAAKSEVAHIDTHAEDFAGAAKLLGRLAEKPNWTEQLKFYFHFFNEVKDSLDEMNKKTKESETAAESQATALATAGK